MSRSMQVPLRLVRTVVFAFATLLLVGAALRGHDHLGGANGSADQCTVCHLSSAPPPEGPTVPAPRAAIVVEIASAAPVAPSCPVPPLAVAPKTSPPAQA